MRMTDQHIKTACADLSRALREDRPDDAANAATSLLESTLKAIHSLADSLERIAGPKAVEEWPGYRDDP